MATLDLTAQNTQAANTTLPCSLSQLRARTHLIETYDVASTASAIAFFSPPLLTSHVRTKLAVVRCLKICAFFSDAVPDVQMNRT